MTLRALRDYLIRPHPAEAPRTVWFQEEARAERMAGLIRIVYMLGWLAATVPAIPIHPRFANIANVCGGLLWLIWAVLFQAYLLKRPYRPAIKYLSLTVDILFVAAILFTYRLDGGYSNTLKAPAFMNYFLILALAGFRFDLRTPLYAGLLAALSYIGLMGYFMWGGNIVFGTPLETLTSPKVNLPYLLYNVVYLGMFTLLIVIFVRNVHRLVELRTAEAEKAFAEKVRREKTLEVLERYFTPSIARHLLENPQELGGKTQRVTVVVCDVRDFTALSERLGPARSVEVLNTLFERLVSVVFSYGGTLDKFLGDGMLIVFGVPSPAPDDALRALKAAAEMAHVAGEVGREVGLRVGLAVHTGEVLLGNIGSSKRMEFTIIGDTVNTASRMESLNKELGTTVLLSESTYRATEGAVKVRNLPSANLRGKTEAVCLFELQGFT